MIRALLQMARHPILALRISYALYRDLKGLPLQAKVERLQQLQAEVSKITLTDKQQP